MPDTTPELLDELERLSVAAREEQQQDDATGAECSAVARCEAQAALLRAAPTLLSTARLASAQLAEIRRLREVMLRLADAAETFAGSNEEFPESFRADEAAFDVALTEARAALAGGEETR